MSHVTKTTLSFGTMQAMQASNHSLNSAGRLVSRSIGRLVGRRSFGLSIEQSVGRTVCLLDGQSDSHQSVGQSVSPSTTQPSQSVSHIKHPLLHWWRSRPLQAAAAPPSVPSSFFELLGVVLAPSPTATWSFVSASSFQGQELKGWCIVTPVSGFR